MRIMTPRIAKELLLQFRKWTREEQDMKLLYALVRNYNEDLWWQLYQKSRSSKSKLMRKYYIFRYMRMTAKNGGYIGPETTIMGKPDLKHDWHGIHINRNAIIGKNVQICSNVVIGTRGGGLPCDR